MLRWRNITKIVNVVASYFLLVKIWPATPAETASKTILLWYSRQNMWPPKHYYSSGNKIFVDNNCTYTNCYIHLNQNIYKNYNSSNFDAIIFHGQFLNQLGRKRMPMRRRPEQIFIFLLLESADLHTVCLPLYDGFFNWTITYRLDSDIPWPYFKIKTLDNVTIGPKKRVSWMHPRMMANISTGLETIINRKNRIAAWFVSKCTTKSRREMYVDSLSEELSRLTTQHVDLYGSCGGRKCPKNESSRCNNLLKKGYFFYMAMENSFDKDYVTEKFYRGLAETAVPIVYGGADYSRFAPPGSYINARSYTPRDLAALMVKLMIKRTRYYNYFKWLNHYYYSNNIRKINIACKLCAKLNQNTKVKTYKKFRRWWNKNYRAVCYKLGSKNDKLCQ